MSRLRTYLSGACAALRKHKLIVGGLLVAGVVVLAVPAAYTFVSTRGHRYDLGRTAIAAVPFHHVTLVFGAGILPNGTPTPYLQERVQTAADLYRAHRTDLLLMSGDNSVTYHNEPQVMKNYAIKLGIPARAIIVDDAGFDTYDSCYRAHALFGLTSATLVSQGYHLPRAMVTCQHLGVSNTGVIALHPNRDYTISYLLRELVSTDKMVLQLIFKPHPPVLGPPLPL